MSTYALSEAGHAVLENYLARSLKPGVKISKDEALERAEQIEDGLKITFASGECLELGVHHLHFRGDDVVEVAERAKAPKAAKPVAAKKPGLVDRLIGGADADASPEDDAEPPAEA